MPKLSNAINFVRRQPRWRLGLAVLVVVFLGGWWWKGGGKTASKTLTFAARRGPLEITVLEGGSLQALESQEIKCEVRGYQGTKILRIVEEGYLVTEEDVKTNKVLCELDSSELQKQIVQQEIQYQSAVASLTDAEQNYEIQLGQNESDILAAEQKTRFARMDFDKFLGDTVTPEIIAQIGLDQIIAAASTNNVEATTHAEEVSAEKAGPPSSPPGKITRAGGADSSPPAPAIAMAKLNTDSPPLPATPNRPPAPDAGVKVVEPPPPESPSRLMVDFSKFASLDVLGDGEAKQKLRKFEDDLQVAKKELEQAKTQLDGTSRLFDKGFVPRTELVRDEIAHESNRLKVQTAETAQELFLKYEFPKTAEEWLSKFADAVREQDKARRVAISKLAQARARLNSAKGQYDVQLRQRKDLNEQLEKCTLLAKKTGLVVYGGGGDQMVYYGNQEPIREGATVRERQAIITIPDLSRMSVNVKIHESYIKKIKKGLKARITVDAFPDDTLTGEITKVGVLPDSQNRWMSPDLKVYVTSVTIDGSHDWVKPGMSAKVEILVKKLDDVVYIPLQAVSPDEGKQICYVAGGFKPERREVEVGEFTDNFIQVKSGLREGERVLLRLPDGVETNRNGQESKPSEPPNEKPTAPVTPAAAPARAAKT